MQNFVKHIDAKRKLFPDTATREIRYTRSFFFPSIREYQLRRHQLQLEVRPVSLLKSMGAPRFRRVRLMRMDENEIKRETF